MGGYSDIFIYIHKLGPLLGVQNLEFHYSFFFRGGGGGGQKYHYFVIYLFIFFLGGGGGGCMKMLWIYHYKTGLVLGAISIHFRVSS